MRLRLWQNHAMTNTPNLNHLHPIPLLSDLASQDDQEVALGGEHIGCLALEKIKLQQIHLMLHVQGQDEGETHAECLRQFIQVQHELDRAFSAIWC